MKKIVIVVFLFLPEKVAGTEMATYNIAKRLNDHDISVITSLDKGLPSESIMDGFKVYRIYRPGKNNKIGVLLSAPLFWISIFFKLWKLKPDLVHFQGLSTGIIGIFSKKILKIPYIVWPRGSDVYLPHPIMRLLHKSIFENASSIVALTEYMKKTIKKVTDKEINVIPNGVDLSKFTVNENKSNIRHELNIPLDKTILILVGRLYPVKGVEYLIESISFLKETRDDFKLLIIGDGSERSYLEKLSEELNITNYVEFRGKIPNDEVPLYLKASDIFILPSLSEGFPNALLEAMASGLPVVTTKIRGLDEIVEEGINGFLVNPKSPEEIANKVDLIMQDNTLSERFSQNNKLKAKEYEWETVIKKLNEIYKKSLNEN